MKKNYRSKVVGLVSTITLSAVAVTGITVGVLAATTQNAKNVFNVTYEANNVAATLRASSKVGANGTPVNFVDSSNTSNEYITFVATDSTETGTLQVPGEDNEIVLDANNNYVVIKNSFTNNITAGRYLVVDFVNPIIAETNEDNIDVLYFPSNYGKSTNFETYAKIKTVGNGSAFDDLTLPGEEGHNQMYIAPGETFYVYTLIEITDDTLDVEVTANTQTAFNLSTVTSENVPAAWTTYVTANEDKWGRPAINLTYPGVYTNDSNSPYLYFKIDEDLNVTFINRYSSPNSNLRDFNSGDWEEEAAFCRDVQLKVVEDENGTILEIPLLKSQMEAPVLTEEELQTYTGTAVYAKFYNLQENTCLLYFEYVALENGVETDRQPQMNDILLTLVED